MTVVKFCGMRRAEDIDAVNRLKPEYVGFVFVPSRKRYISPDEAAALREKLSPEIKAVGVFVNEDISTVRDLLWRGIIDIAQLHGTESENYIRTVHDMTDKQVIKAFGIQSAPDLEKAYFSSADLVLLDSPGGGTGGAFNWELLKDFKRKFFLAGGLDPQNVSEAIKLIDPYGLDVSSGIETDGFKDPLKMEAFMANVRKDIR